MSDRITLLVVDDHAILREGVRRLLEAQPGFQVLGEASTGAEALERVQRLRPQVLILDLSLPDISGLEIIRRVHQSAPEVAIVVLTMHESREYFFRALQAGVSGYVLKAGGLSDLVLAVQAAARGDVYIYPSLTRQLVADLAREPQARPQQALTRRERQVLDLVAQGLTNREIAEHLTIALSTVQTHCTNIMNKLGLRNRAELIRYGVERGLLDSP